MLTQADHEDVGRLLGFALQPTLRPGRSPEYRRALGRYRTEPDFKTAMDAVLHGLDAQVLSDGDMGLVLGVHPESPFAFRYSDVPHTHTREGRLLAGLVIIGIAAFAYPTPEDLDSDRIRHVADIDFENWLRSACERLRVQGAAGEVIPEEGLDEAWREYVNMPVRMVGDRGRGANRLSSKCTLYWVRAIMGWLVEQGMARQNPTAGDNHWTLTERFRAHVRDMASERGYNHLAQIARDLGDARADA